MFKKILAIATICFVLPIHAELIDHGNYFTNTSVGTDYLKLGMTAFYSWDDVVTHDLLGYIADGWSVASQNDYMTLASDQPYTAYLLTQANLHPFIITDNGNNSGQVALPLLVVVDYWQINFVYHAGALGDAAADNTFDQAVALSRPSANPVPTPAAGYLFMASLLGLLTRKQLSKQ